MRAGALLGPTLVKKAALVQMRAGALLGPTLGKEATLAQMRAGALLGPTLAKVEVPFSHNCLGLPAKCLSVREPGETRQVREDATAARLHKSVHKLFEGIN